MRAVFPLSLQMLSSLAIRKFVMSTPFEAWSQAWAIVLFLSARAADAADALNVIEVQQVTTSDNRHMHIDLNRAIRVFSKS